MRKKYRQRATSFRQGHLKKIGDYFKPLFKARPEAMGFMEFLETQIFHVNERRIETFVVAEEFRMPGLYYWLPEKPIPGYGRRMVAQGSCLIVRRDCTTPNVVDVETVPMMRDRPRVFRLTAKEWSKISPFIMRKH